MTVRYVNAKKGKASGKFDKPGSPARNIGQALKVASAGDTIVIQDAATYEVDELIIDKAITIISSYAQSNPSLDPTGAGFDVKKLPKLRPKAKTKKRVLRIIGSPATRASAGPVVIKGIRIDGGHAKHSSSDPGFGAGGGIVVVDIDNVTIERCVISGNSTETLPIGTWPEPDRIAFRNAVVDLVGEIVSPSFEKYLNKLLGTVNTALSLLSVMTIPLFSRSAVLAAIEKAFDKKLSSGRPNHWLAGQAFGGGIAAVWASPTIRRCLIRDNVAQGRGAGVAVVGYGWPTLDGCLIDQNHSGSTGRRDGGGIGCEIALPGKMSRNLSEIDLIKFLTGKIAGVKAMIGSPMSHISFSDIIDYAKWLANPSQPSPPVRGIKAIILDLINARWDQALDHLFYFFASSALSRNRWDAWNKDEIDQAQKNAVTIKQCKVSGNRCADDGGGLYASVLSRMNITESKFINNVAESSGGGIRLSMGSAGDINGCELTGNTAIVDDPTNKLIAGGGGLSVRNADISLSNTRIGPSSGNIGPDSNVTSDHAGGGFAFQADTEGNLAGIPDLWTAIMVEVFGVRSLKVTVSANCAINNNGAGYDAQRKAIGKPSKAKGGGIWLLQGAFPDAPKVTFKVESVASNVRGNTAQTKSYTSKVQTGVTIADANEICIQDVINHKEWTNSNYSSLLSGGTLNFTP
ncbi:MAG: hypothetical protein ACXV8O_11790 [Methylobacter sp.]